MKCLAAFIKITRARIGHRPPGDAPERVTCPSGLKHHDLLGDLLRVVWFMSSDLHLTKPQAALWLFPAGSVATCRYFAERGFRFVELLLFGGSVAKIKPKIPV